MGVHYSKVRSLTLDGWEPEIIKVMMELGNNVINSIYEANYIDSMDSNVTSSDLQSSIIQRATPECSSRLRENWIRAKYIDKKFVMTIEQFKNSKLSGAQTTKTFMDEVIFKENSWCLRHIRKIKIKLRIEKIKKFLKNDSQLSNENVNESGHIYNELSFDSDSDSFDENVISVLHEESFDDFNSDMLLYKATAVENLPVMCYALASGASKEWSHPTNLRRTAVHEAVLTVSCNRYLRSGYFY